MSGTWSQGAQVNTNTKNQSQTAIEGDTAVALHVQPRGRLQVLEELQDAVLIVSVLAGNVGPRVRVRDKWSKSGELAYSLSTCKHRSSLGIYVGDQTRLS